MGNFNILHVDAIETMVGYLGNGAPLNSLLVEAYPYAWQGMSDALVEGIAQGLSPRETARKMADGMSDGLDRILRIARTEQLRAYRQATVMQYRESGVVAGYRRLVAKAKACLACLMSDGELFRTADDLSDHPNGACTCIPILYGVEERDWLKGEQWFKSLESDRQKEIMGADYYRAWKSDKFKLKDLVTHSHSDIWGDAPQVKALKELV
jgi:SPP1 gp7 family putative phage head morphogenesis protein